jgi:hypothetical protein
LFVWLALYWSGVQRAINSRGHHAVITSSSE